MPTDLTVDHVELGIQDSVLENLPNLDRIDRFTLRLPYGFVAQTYHLHPLRGGDRLALYHHGHVGGFRRDAHGTIGALLADGFSVVGIDMPMRGQNTWPQWIDVPKIGPVSFSKPLHWSLAILENEDFSPLRLFLDPVLGTLNHLSEGQGYRDIIMVGLSGGGWTTTVYAALDARIRKSYPVAGSLPFALQGPNEGGRSSEGDYEQRHPKLHAITSFLDLYVMGAAGRGRRQVQILNEFDPCCFPGGRGTVYAGQIEAAVRQLGSDGSWALAIDWGSRRHEISQRVMDLILHDAREPQASCLDTVEVSAIDHRA